MNEIKSIHDLLSAYADGDRHFINLDIEGSLKGADLSRITFQKCFLLCDFQGTNFEGARFENSNIKTCSFRGVNLKNAVFIKCAVEGIDCVGANIENILFEGNYYMGSVMEQDDILGFC